MEPEVIRDKEAMRKWSRRVRSQGKTIGLVPTMGYLHDGHLSLVRQSLTLTDLTVVSIYVNPGQFSPTEDLSSYPSDFSGDLAKLAALSGDKVVVFNPKNLYDYGGDNGRVRKKINGGDGGRVVSCVEEGGLGHETWVRVERLEKGLCGMSRPVFFRGVATIVTKLFNIVEPDIAVFGKKDYQQWRIIKRMVRDLDFGIEIVGSEIAREKDGLAMSSRNVRLSDEERQRALSISRSLAMAKASAAEGQIISCAVLKDMIIQQIVEAAGRVDYVQVNIVSSGMEIGIRIESLLRDTDDCVYMQIVDQETLEEVEEIQSRVVICVAAWFGMVRLIDNIEINVSQTSDISSKLVNLDATVMNDKKKVSC